MSRDEIEKLANMFGATIVGELPDFGGGAFAAAQHAAFYQERMSQLRAEEKRTKESQPLSVSLSNATVKALEEIAKHNSTPEERRSAADVAADILQLAAARRVEEIHQIVTGHRKTG